MKIPMILDGRAYAAVVEQELKERVQKLKEKTKKNFVLATVIVGSFGPSVTYVNMKCRACDRIGLEWRKVELAENVATEQVVAAVQALNNDEQVCGILVQHPLPKQVDEHVVFGAISLEKDVDGLNSASYGLAAMKQKAYFCATPLAIVSLLKHYNQQISGKHAVVIGRSSILGKPVAMMLLNEDATVTICHTKTQNLEALVKQADILVAAVGRSKFVKAQWLKEGVVIIDAGYNQDGTGDVDLENATEICSAYTPVPGGVGPVTIAMLMKQSVEAAEARV